MLQMRLSQCLVISALSFAAQAAELNTDGSEISRPTCSCCLEDQGRGCIDPAVREKKHEDRRNQDEAKRPSQEARDALYKEEQEVVEPSSPGCARFCDFVMNYCQEEKTAWPTLNNCLTNCSGFSTTPSNLPYRDIIGENSLQCREFWMDRIERSLVETGKIPDGMCDYVGTEVEVDEFDIRIVKYEDFATGLYVNQTSDTACTVALEPTGLIEERNSDYPRELRVRKGDEFVGVKGMDDKDWTKGGSSDLTAKFYNEAVVDLLFKRRNGGGMCSRKLTVSCENYCDQLTVNPVGGATGVCGNGTWQFLSRQNCRKHCPKFRREPDATDHINGNTLECRMMYLSIAETHAGGSLFRSYSRPELQPEYCHHASLRSKACKDDKEVDRCQDYCHWNSVWCDKSETLEKCSAYCAALAPEKLDCHLKYVSMAARCNNPEVPCFHRSVCNAAGSATAIGFESAPIPPAYRGPLKNHWTGEKPVSKPENVEKLHNIIGESNSQGSQQDPVNLVTR